MAKILVQGGNRLEGKITISGAKNAALPLIAAALLTDKPLVLTNMPGLDDVQTMSNLMKGLGVSVERDRDAVTFDAARLSSTKAPEELVRTMRASVLVLGPLVAREGKAQVALPGGCAIGARPVDLHLSALEQMGADITIRDGFVEAVAPDGLRGAFITFPKVSVGATENLLMAATLAKGETVLNNAAQEPEITDLADCLRAMGANITGIGTSRLTIQGVPSLHGTVHPVVADRIEAGTFAVAAAMTRGDLLLENARADHLTAPIDILRRVGATVLEQEGSIRVHCSADTLTATDFTTEPFPAFPTDLQAQFMAMMSIASGTAVIRETIFENRFMHVPELTRMGASISINDRSAIVRGVGGLTGAHVIATDLRASVAMVLAGLVAEGQTEIGNIYHLDRGYDQVEAKLSAVGASIQRVES
jgi:UDP-N-acetylglucosamine 1-carboxyvinyltransferase